MTRPARLHARDAGFTLMELMITVAIIGVLAAVALPGFAGTARRANGDSEVNAFFAELRVREEQYQLEYGRYVSTGATEVDTFPAAPSQKAAALGALPAIWTALRVRPPMASARCAYVVIAGTPSDAPGTFATGQFGYVPPAGKNWFYALAHCDLDGDAALDAYYFTSSDSSDIQKLNPGR